MYSPLQQKLVVAITNNGGEAGQKTIDVAMPTESKDLSREISSQLVMHKNNSMTEQKQVLTAARSA